MENKLDIINKQIEKISKVNSYTSRYGLSLTDKDILDIVAKKVEALKDTGRLELGDWLIDKIIKKFCDSPYLEQGNYKDTLYELIDMFYYYKNETNDLISDDELLDFMKEKFDNIAQGDLDYLSSTILNQMTDNLLNGREINYLIDSNKFESEEEYGQRLRGD